MKKLVSDEEYYNNLPKKHIGAMILIFNESHQLLIVKPNYKEGWSIPGGGVNTDESPKEAVIRETKEELGLDLKNITLICVEYTSKKEIKPETLQFVFYGGELDINEISQISLDKNENSEFRFVEIPETSILLHKSQQRRIPFCVEAIKNKNTAYMES